MTEMSAVIRRHLVLLVMSFVLPSLCAAQQTSSRWTEADANAWYARQPWLVGSNYIPASAINELEMWQAETFNPQQIDEELGWAEGLGMNTMRVFLHDLLWQQDANGFKSRVDQFLTMAARHHIRPIFVLFDSCWDPRPALGPQHPPVPGVHNSGWMQAPGARGLQDASQYGRLSEYVQGVVGAFANDPRVLAWDVWNEPDNTNGGSYGRFEPKNKIELVAALLPQVFAWARNAHPSQPLTSGLWHDSENWASPEKLTPLERVQVQLSDIISFHNYGWPETFERDVTTLRAYHRPIVCTEFMARSLGSLFDTVLPIAKKAGVGAINWGLVVGKTQTNLPWDSWQHPYISSDPPVWSHEVFRSDGKPYREREAELIRELTRGAARTAAQ
jgi:hypothetical protein